ncbi:MAG: ABC transporter substrate-binding protein [Hyphomicrobiaceae bacterium]
MASWKLSRRKFVSTSAAAAAATVAAPFVRTAGAAGKLSIGMWDHWVPNANKAFTTLANEWAEKEKVDINIDFITSQGNKLLLTVAAEAQAGSGHDLITMTNWQPSEYANKLADVDDVVTEAIKNGGDVSTTFKHFGRAGGKWRAVPSSRGTLSYSSCSRIDLFKQHGNIDLQAMFPAGKDPVKDLVDKWTWEEYVKVAEACKKAGKPFGLPMGQTADTVQWVGALFAAYGAQLVDSKGNITVKSDKVRHALEIGKRLMAALPPEVYAWDDASNNKWLVSGRGASIFNPPSAWAVAKRDAPDIAKEIWHHAAPKGPEGRFIGTNHFYHALWDFSSNKSAAKSLLRHLSTRRAAEMFVNASLGYDLPPYATFNDFNVWTEQGPPKGTLTHYPNKGDQQSTIAAFPAPYEVGQQIYSQATMPKMLAKVAQENQPIDKVLDWAASELEGFTSRR